MAEIICIANRKGGSGKTTTCAALACALKEQGKKVLCVDLDSQTNLSVYAGYNRDEMGVREALIDPSEAIYAIQNLELFDLMAADDGLDPIEHRFMAGAEAPGRYHRLKKALDYVENQYDYILIDTPASLGFLTLSGLTASDWVVIASDAEEFATEGTELLVQAIESVRSYQNPNLKIAGILITKFRQTNLQKSYFDYYHKYGTKRNIHVFETPIRLSTVVGEAQDAKESIYQYCPQYPVVDDYRKFVFELLMRIEGGEIENGEEEEVC